MKTSKLHTLIAPLFAATFLALGSGCVADTNDDATDGTDSTESDLSEGRVNGLWKGTIAIDSPFGSPFQVRLTNKVATANLGAWVVNPGRYTTSFEAHPDDGEAIGSIRISFQGKVNGVPVPGDAMQLSGTILHGGHDIVGRYTYVHQGVVTRSGNFSLGR
ncbi:MAG: hypothetical protein HOO96_37865 [Polyangiaceae bacterium]|nr:hypothetical protein [Polyangiaceae bacterium]